MPNRLHLLAHGAIESAIARDSEIREFVLSPQLGAEPDPSLLNHIQTNFDLDESGIAISVLMEILAKRAHAERLVDEKRQQHPHFGDPTSEFSAGRKRGGYVRHYQHGSIFWTERFGVHEVHGAIRDKYAQLGWETSYLGYPSTDEIGLSGDTRYNNFEGGTISWSPNRGAYIDLTLDVRREKHQLGAWLHIKGKGATPGGEVTFRVEDLEGATGPKMVGVWDVGRADGQYGKIVWDARTWERGGNATLVACDAATGRTAKAPLIPAVW